MKSYQQIGLGRMGRKMFLKVKERKNYVFESKKQKNKTTQNTNTQKKTKQNKNKTKTSNVALDFHYFNIILGISQGVKVGKVID